MEKCRITERVVSLSRGCFRYRITGKVTPLSERKRYETNNALKVAKRQYFRDNLEMSKGNAPKRSGNIAQITKKWKHRKLILQTIWLNLSTIFFITIGPDLAREISKTNFKPLFYLRLVSLAPNVKTI